MCLDYFWPLLLRQCIYRDRELVLRGDLIHCYRWHQQNAIFSFMRKIISSALVAGRISSVTLCPPVLLEKIVLFFHHCCHTSCFLLSGFLPSVHCYQFVYYRFVYWLIIIGVELKFFVTFCYLIFQPVFLISTPFFVNLTFSILFYFGVPDLPKVFCCSKLSRKWYHPLWRAEMWHRACN